MFHCVKPNLASLKNKAIESVMTSPKQQINDSTFCKMAQARSDL